LLGVLLTPALAAVLFHTSGVGLNANAVVSIGIQILLPFALGQIARPWVGEWIGRHKGVSLFVDRGSILLIVYSAFSAGVVAGIWQRVDATTLTIMVIADIVLLATIMAFGWFAGKSIGLPREDRMVMLFCGSTKSLASGIPIANILFVGQPIGLIVLPLMLFHQIQLFVCAIIAQRQASRLSQTLQIA
jgi:sodium/bile acid cotransporter 7